MRWSLDGRRPRPLRGRGLRSERGAPPLRSAAQPAGFEDGCCDGVSVLIVLRKPPVHLRRKRDGPSRRPRDGGQEVLAVQRAQGAPFLGGDRRRAGDVPQQRDLAEEVAWSQGRQRGACLPDNDLALLDQVEAITGLALRDDDVAGSRFERYEISGDPFEVRRTEGAEDRCAAQK